MPPILLAMFLLGVTLSPRLVVAGMPLGRDCVAEFATVEEGAALLGSADAGTRRMSPFDRVARLKSAGRVSPEEHLAFAARCVLPWTTAEREAVTAAVAVIDPRLTDLGVVLPERVLLIKTSGAEEARAAYTRGTAIVLPEHILTSPPDVLQRLVCHELFHVLSRSSPALREKLYATIGFFPCGDVVLPGELESRRITNPDAPFFDHCIRVTVDGRKEWVVPVLYSRSEYDAASRRDFFATMNFRLLVVRLEGEPSTAAPHLKNGRAILLETGAVSGFFEQVGRNTQYLIHPEEILADNFQILVLDASPAASPEIVRGVAEVLRHSAQ